MQGHRIAFGPFAFDTSTLTLWRDGALVSLGRRGAALLLALLETGSGVASKELLLERGWPGAIVEESNLVVQVATLRKILGQRPDGSDWIATVPRVGYRLVRGSEGEAIAKQDRRPALAVLPFVNMSGDPSQDYLADGLVEDLITAFSRFTNFSVAARQSSFAFRDRALDIREIAAALGVRYVLEGSVRRNGRDVRITVQLIDGQSGEHIWATKFDGPIDNLFAFQDRVTSNVIGVIEPQIRRAEIERARRKPPENLDAYDLYLQALPLVLGGRTVQLEDYDAAIALLERSLALDPDFAPALTIAAWAHEGRLTRGGTPPPGVDDAKAAIELAERALTADGEDALALLVAGTVRITVKGEAEEGFALVRHAAALNPNSLIIATTAAYFHWLRGSFEDSIAAFEHALMLAPEARETVWTLSGLARVLLAVGRIEEALATGLRALEFGSVEVFAPCIVAACYAQLGRVPEARETVARTLATWPETTASNLFGTVGPRPGDRLLVEGLLLAGLASD